MSKFRAYGDWALDLGADVTAGDHSEDDDLEFFVGLCWEEVEALCQAVGADELSVFLLRLHIAGLTDQMISDRLQMYLPIFSLRAGLTAGAIQMRRQRLISRIKDRPDLAGGVGLITAMRESFRKSR